MTEIQFVKISPTQNMTILVESPAERGAHQRIAGELLRYDSIFAEQVGFIEKPASSGAWSRLQMMGGEFCGNATMALAAFLVWQRKNPAGSVIDVPLEVSGADGILHCRVAVGDGSFHGTVNMPVPEKIETLALPVNGKEHKFTTVYLPGIIHVLAPISEMGENPRELAEKALVEWESLIASDAYGIMLFDEDACRIEPLVRVKSANSIVWERGCGTGTAAVGSYLATKSGADIKAEVAQPGGVITVEVKYADNAVRGISISGEVRVVGRGVAYVDI